MKLAIYCPDFYPAVSGYSFAFQDLVRGLCDEGVEVDVFTPGALGAASELVIPGLRVIRLQHTEPLRHIKYARALWNVLSKPRQTAAIIAREHQSRRYDAVLSETMEDPLILLSLPSELRARTIVRVHGCAETEQAMWDRTLVWRFKHRLIEVSSPSADTKTEAAAEPNAAKAGAAEPSKEAPSAGAIDAGVDASPASK